MAGTPLPPESNADATVLKVNYGVVDEELLQNPRKNLELIITNLIYSFVDLYKAKNFIRGDEVLGLYCWDGVKYYECENLVGEWLHSQYISLGLDKHNIKYISFYKEFRKRLEDSTHVELRAEAMSISFRNGVFDWNAFLELKLGEAFREHDPNLYVFHHIPHNLRWELLEDNLKGLEKYTAPLTASKIEELAGKVCPKSLKAFKEWVGDKYILLFEIIGYTLFPQYVLNKAVMLIGEGSNGKSTYLALISNILGSENIVSISLQELCDEDERFAVHNLYHKLANIYPDIPNRAIVNTGRFKLLTGEDKISADRKFRTRITFKNYAKLIFSANQLPPVNDMTLAFWRRWLVIEFPNKFPQNPNYFTETFTEDEIEGIIVVSILAFRDAYFRRKFSFEETEADYKETWLKNTNTVYAFIKDKLIMDPDSRVEAGELYQHYVSYCSENDLEPLAKRNFTIELERFGVKKVKVRGYHYYKGVRLKTEEGTSLPPHPS